MDKTKDFLKKAKKNLFGSSASKTTKVDASTQTSLADFNYHATSNLKKKNEHFHRERQQPSTSTFHETNPFRMQTNTTNRYDLSKYEYRYPTRFVHNSNTRNKNNGKDNFSSSSSTTTAAATTTTYNQQKQDHIDYNEAQRIFWNQLQSRMKEKK